MMQPSFGRNRKVFTLVNAFYTQNISSNKIKVSNMWASSAARASTMFDAKDLEGCQHGKDHHADQLAEGTKTNKYNGKANNPTMTGMQRARRQRKAEGTVAGK